VPTVTITGLTGSTEFEGTLIAETTTYSDSKPRWLEIRLYRRDGGGWVLHRASKSLVYHSISSRCHRKKGELSGTPVTVGELLDLEDGFGADAEPCPNCSALDLDRMPLSARVRFEYPRHTINHCQTVEEVVDNLTVDRRTAVRSWSAPVTDLLTKAAMVAEEFRSRPAQQGVIKID
jgi:hypothetical protein